MSAEESLNLFLQLFPHEVILDNALRYCDRIVYPEGLARLSVDVFKNPGMLHQYQAEQDSVFRHRVFAWLHDNGHIRLLLTSPVPACHEDLLDFLADKPSLLAVYQLRRGEHAVAASEYLRSADPAVLLYTPEYCIVPSLLYAHTLTGYTNVDRRVSSSVVHG